MGKLLCIAALLLSATGLRADVFSFSYSGTGLLGSVSASGEITASGGSGGNYTITNITGTETGAFAGSMSVDPFETVLSYNGSSGSFEFLIDGLIPVAIAFSGGSFTLDDPIEWGSNFQMVGAPEAGTLSLLVTIGLGVWVLARKLPLKKHS